MPQVAGKQQELSGLSAPLDPLERDEPAPHHAVILAWNGPGHAAEPLSVPPRSIVVRDMSRGRSRGLVSLLTFGVAAFLVACLSILDMFLPRPYDGVILDPDRSEIVVRARRSRRAAARDAAFPGRCPGLGELQPLRGVFCAGVFAWQRFGDERNSCHTRP